MPNLTLLPTATAQWHALVSEAQSLCAVTLKEDIESYLVFMLMRFIDATSPLSQPMALAWLESLNKIGQIRQQDLRNVGDQCLLCTGLFPGLARKRHVSLDYYVDLGRSAYHTLSSESSELSKLYSDLEHDFVNLVDVLHATHELGQQNTFLDPLQAEELWRKTGSLHAKATLDKYTGTSYWTQFSAPSDEVH